jgi:serum/glucocorticoid-regulated kinase 2
LIKEPAKRLGAKGAAEVKEHPWFEKVNFEALFNKKIKAPCAPILKSSSDTANFGVEFTSCPVHSYEESPAGTIENDKFKDFSYGDPA